MSDGLTDGSEGDDTRWNPYMFMKSPTIVIADGESIRLPSAGRDRLGVRAGRGLGRTADHVAADRAGDYIFGYTLENDVSDRGGRSDTRHGSDWVISRPRHVRADGPFIVPKEFVPNPQNLRSSSRSTGS